VGEVSWTQWPQLWPDQAMPDDLRSLRKFRKVGVEAAPAALEEAEAGGG
jgi:hypothetical protein